MYKLNPEVYCNSACFFRLQLISSFSGLKMMPEPLIIIIAPDGPRTSQVKKNKKKRNFFKESVHLLKNIPIELIDCTK